MRISVICAIIFLFAGSLFARIINVPGEYATIQAGIDDSVNGDTVLVAPGEYHEDFVIANRNILLTSSQGPDTTLIYGTCILRGDLDSTCIVRGLSLIGTGHPYSTSLIGCTRGTMPKIEGNILRNNIGSAISSQGGNPIIRGNIIRDNWIRGNGGGISLGFFGYPTDNAEISGNVICRNRAGFTVHGDGMGGGIYLMGNAKILYNLIYDNIASEPLYGGDGGGIWRAQMLGDTGHATIIAHNTICNNSAKLANDHGRGGGLLFISNGAQDSLYVVNNIFAFNYWGGNVKGRPHDSMYFYWDYNLVYPDTAMEFPHGEHDLYLDPLFVDTAAEDYRLLSNSPCIDAGDPSSPLDPDSTRADIGAYYFDQSVGIDEDGAPTGPHQFSLKQNYPNPFNSQTIISYYLDKESTVSLHIYSITGHLILPLINKEIQKEGEHKYTWEGRDANGKTVSTGIYFYELYVNDYRESKAMIMIK